MSARVGDAICASRFSSTAAWTCQRLSAALAQGRTGALVRDGERFGISTTTDLRDAGPSRPPAIRCAGRDLRAARSRSDDGLYAALILMLRHPIHRVIVRDGEAVVGGLTSSST